MPLRLWGRVAAIAVVSAAAVLLLGRFAFGLLGLPSSTAFVLAGSAAGLYAVIVVVAAAYATWIGVVNFTRIRV